MSNIPKHTLEFLDSWLAMRQKWADIPGFVVAISHKGKTIFKKAYGFADFNDKVPMAPDHVFRIASHSKTFTATAIMQLQEKGKLRIDDLVVDYLPWLKEHSDARWSEVTIRQLLSHSAGIIRDGTNSNYWQLENEFPDIDELKNQILSSQLLVEPNSKMKYSNFGYSLLGQIIESISGVSYGEYVTEHIIDELGLRAMSPDMDAKLKYVTAHSRLRMNGGHYVLPNVATNAMAAATGFSADAESLLRYFEAQMVGTGKLLTDVSKKEMQRQQWTVENASVKSSYGLGLEHAKYSGLPMIGHGGGFPGTSTLSMFSAERELVVVVLANTNAPVGSILGSAVEIIKEMGEKEPAEKFKKFEVRYSTLWGTFEVVATQHGLKGAWSNGWYPLSETDSLEIHDDTTLKVTKTDGFSSFAESIVYEFDDAGRVLSVIDTGAKYKPSTDGDVVVSWN